MSASAEIAAELGALRDAGACPFDVHSHTGVDVDGSARTSEEQLAAVEAVGGRSVVFPFCVEGGYAGENSRVVEEARCSEGRLVPFARLDPHVDAAAEAAAALSAGARGFKLHPRAESFELSHPGVEGILAVAAEARVPTLIHAGTGVGCFGAVVLELAERNRGCPIVLAHAGISDLGWIWPEVAQHPNLFFDTAWLVPSDLLALFALIPPGRILFGSDAPFMDFDLLLAMTLRCARCSGLDEEAIRLVMGGQLATLLAGEAPVEAGDAPGAPLRAPQPNEARLSSLLAAAGGCLLGGGNPEPALELAALVVAGDGQLARGRATTVPALIEEARSDPEAAVRAIVLALTLAMSAERDPERLVA